MDPPKPGEIVDGYVFKGGDPKDQGSWTLPPALGQGSPPGAPTETIPKTGDVVDGYSFKGGDPKDQKSWTKVYTTGEALDKATNMETLLSSGSKRVEEVVHAVTHPWQTISAIGRVGLQLQPDNIVKYAGTKLKAMMSSGEEAKKLDQEASAMMSGVEPILQDYYETYGSKEKFLKTLAEDPTRLLSDLSNIAMPLKGGVTKAGTAGRIANVAGHVAENLDIPTAIVNATGKLAELGGKGVTAWGGVKTGAGGAAIREAAEAAAKGGEHFDDFRRGFSGALTEDEMVGRARQGARTMRDNMQAEYTALKGGLGTGNIPAFGDIDQALKKADDSLRKTYPSGQTSMTLSPADQRTWQNVLDVVEQWRNDPTRHTVVGLDDLKQAVRNQLSWTDKNRNLQRAVTEVTDGIIGSVKKHAPPEYGKMLSQYADAAKQVEEIEKEFALGKNRTPQQAMTRLQSLMRNNVNTRYGNRMELADILEKDGGVRLKSGIAGMTMNTAEPRGIARIGASVPILGPGIGFMTSGPIGALVGAGLEQVATSPKVWGYGAQAYGLGKRALDAKARIGKFTTPSAREVITAPFKPPAIRGGEVIGRQELQNDNYAFGGKVERPERKLAFARYGR